jgi:hypothetical protein
MALHMKGGTVEGLGMKQLEQLRYGSARSRYGFAFPEGRPRRSVHVPQKRAPVSLRVAATRGALRSSVAVAAT